MTSCSTVTFVLEEQALSVTLHVVVEAQLGDRITCNGHAVKPTQLIWLDPDWICYEIALDALNIGANNLELELLENRCILLENLYIIGDFHVYFTKEGLPLLTNPSRPTTGSGNLTVQGFPFYAGRMELHTLLNAWDYGSGCEEGSWVLRISKPYAASVTLFVNGVECATRAWDPWEWEFKGEWLKDTCELCFVISTTLRNLIGPHHYKNDEQLNFLTPSHFFDLDHWTDERVLVAFGLEHIYLERNGEL